MLFVITEIKEDGGLETSLKDQTCTKILSET